MLEHWPTPFKRSQIVFITRDLSRNYVLEVLAAVRSAAPASPRRYGPMSSTGTTAVGPPDR